MLLVERLVVDDELLELVVELLVVELLVVLELVVELLLVDDDVVLELLDEGDVHSSVGTHSSGSSSGQSKHVASSQQGPF